MLLGDPPSIFWRLRPTLYLGAPVLPIKPYEYYFFLHLGAPNRVLPWRKLPLPQTAMVITCKSCGKVLNVRNQQLPGTF